MSINTEWLTAMNIAASEWLTAKNILTSALNEFYPPQNYDQRERNDRVASALLARLASNSTPMLVVFSENAK